MAATRLCRLLLPSCLLVIAALTGQVMSECKRTDTSCEFWLHVDHKLTMMKGRGAVYPQGGNLYMWDDDTASQPIKFEDVISTDGYENHRLVVAVNDTIPGPAIEVWEGQNVIIHVTNLMASTSVTIHWHGLHQKGTPWMDGVSFITQCPIEPLQTFTYRFKAAPSGTFWYHSHIGSQLAMGLVGPFIIRTKEDNPENEHILMLQEWNHDFDAEVIMARMVYGSFLNRQKLGGTKSIEGTYFSMFPFHTGLINGRGRYHFNNGTHNGAPLTTFAVSQGKTYRFRMIGSGTLYPFRVSIDEHPLTVIATDGYDITPTTVDAIIINPGERYDFLIHANMSTGRFWVRAETLEVNVTFHVAEAVLEYVGTPGPSGEATSSPRLCTADDRCTVLNCPFLFYPDEYHSDCIHAGNLRSKVKHEVPGAGPDEEVKDLFFNFAFPGITSTPGSVNGRAFRHNGQAALTQPRDAPTSCDPEACGEDKICHCPYSIALEHNKVYQVVMMNMGTGRGWAHPIHMHGHSYHVVKIGFPSYAQGTGKVGADNPDIDCGGQTTNFCNEASWANSSWGGNSVPGLELDLPPRKDTIMVPSGGYVVVRIKADNPGVWFMHCHIELHSGDGMAVMLNESFTHQAPPPVDFPTCNSFRYEKQEYAWPGSKTRPQTVSKSTTTNIGGSDDSDDGIDKKIFYGVVGGLSLVVLLLLFLNILTLSRSRSKKQKDAIAVGSTYDNSGFSAK